MRALVWSAALVSVAILGGCITDDDSAEPPVDTTWDAFRGPVTTERLPGPDIDLSGVIDEDHGGAPWLHAVPELHEGSYAMELVGYNPLTRVGAGDTIGADSGYGAIDVFGHLVCIAHFAGSGGALGGATLVDISDPADPVVLSSLPSGAANSDCQFTDDGKYLVLASYTGADHPLAYLAPPPVGDVGTNGMNLYDVSDPSDPVFLFHDATGAGGDGYHNVFTANIHGTNYIFQTYTGNILKIKEDASGLELVATVEHSDHDMWVGYHPITGEWMMVTGTAAGGTAVFNMEDPENPVLLSVWEPVLEERLTGWHRQWPVENTIDGRAYMVVAGEECGNGDSLPYAVLDWTDPDEMFLTGSWWIPGQPRNAPQPHLCEMNSHEFEIWDGYVATGNYHAGIWLFDVGSPERVAEPMTIGYYLPSEQPQMHGGTNNVPFVWSPDVWGAYFDDRGYVIAADWHTGLYVLKFGATVG